NRFRWFILKDDHFGQEGCKVRSGDRSQRLRFAGSIFKGPLTFEGPWPRQVSRCMSLVDLKDPRPEKKNRKENQMARPTLLLPYPTSTHVHETLKIGAGYIVDRRPQSADSKEEEEEKGSSKLLDNIFPLELKANFLTTQLRMKGTHPGVKFKFCENSAGCQGATCKRENLLDVNSKENWFYG
ncbi:LOW QUALITY PROTEIN: hypothetical protein V1478_003059, partial [Vespula squamosa]